MIIHQRTGVWVPSMGNGALGTWPGFCWRSLGGPHGVQLCASHSSRMSSGLISPLIPLFSTRLSPASGSLHGLFPLLGCSSPKTASQLTAHSLPTFKSLNKCHLLNETSPDPHLESHTTSLPISLPDIFLQSTYDHVNYYIHFLFLYSLFIFPFRNVSSLGAKISVCLFIVLSPVVQEIFVQKINQFVERTNESLQLALFYPIPTCFTFKPWVFLCSITKGIWSISSIFHSLTVLS